MNHYELALVLNAKIEDEARSGILGRIQESIARSGGSVTKVDEWGKRRLAYEIQKMREGFYYFIQFDADPNSPIEIEERLRIMDNVLRYLIVRQDHEPEKVQQAEKAPEAQKETHVVQETQEGEA